MNYYILCRGDYMPDFQEMYYTLFRRVTTAISDLQEAQRQTEEMYISAKPTELIILDTSNVEDDTPPETENK